MAIPGKDRWRIDCRIVADRSAIRTLDRGAIHYSNFSIGPKAGRWSGVATAVSLTAALSGCGSTSLDEYRVVDQSVAISARSEQADSGRDAKKDAAEAPVDALRVENGAMLSVRPEMAANTSDVAVSALEISNPRRVELLVPQKSFSKDRKTGALRITYDDLNLLTVLNMEPVTDDAVSWMPAWMTSLNGQMVRVRGFMLPTFQVEGLEGFALLRDNQVCCYGPGAKIYDHILVKMKEGTTARYVPLQESLDVVGRFKIDLQSAGESVFQLYVIEDAVVISR